MADIIPFPRPFTFRQTDLQELQRWGATAKVGGWYVGLGPDDDTVFMLDDGTETVGLSFGGPYEPAVYFVSRDRNGWIRGEEEAGKEVRFETLKGALESVFDPA